MAHEYSFRFVDTTVPSTITWDHLALWYRNLVTRRALSRLTSDGLRDVGISEAESAVETAKPFWR
ncbi:DUF1127 domain-containing protein [Ruegeria sp.]|uniref:DUF1127 domain-containing protein n=1 Tax=Ruegeria sp. TaxID=1879320 RepID=UPI00230AA58D|nr:DUF1127 domain-containing protein [Ruegeria sp.]MDA7966261.1 DUF1127 domain-containing protein [Ruegeria sp.]